MEAGSYIISKLGKTRYKENDQGCWIWQLGRCGNKSEYGTMRDGRGKRITAHRYFYQLEHGQISSDYHVHHTCGNTLCVNPSHLSVKLSGEHTRHHNKLRILKTHCKNGHEFNSDNTHVLKNGTRKCRVCDKIRHRKNG